MKYPEIAKVVDWQSWHAFFTAHPELCEEHDAIADSDGKYMLATDGYVCRSTTELRSLNIIDDDDIEAWRDAARRVAESEIAQECAMKAQDEADQRMIATYAEIMRTALDGGHPAVTLSKSGASVIFASDALGLGRRDLSSIPERAKRQLVNAGLLSA